MRSFVIKFNELSAKGSETTYKECSAKLNILNYILVDLRNKNITLPIMLDEEFKFVIRQIEVKSLARSYGAVVSEEELKMLFEENEIIIREYVNQYSDYLDGKAIVQDMKQLHTMEDITRLVDALEKLYLVSEVCLDEFLNTVGIENISMTDCVAIYGELFKRIEGDTVKRVREQGDEEVIDLSIISPLDEVSGDIQEGKLFTIVGEASDQMMKFVEGSMQAAKCWAPMNVKESKSTV